MSNSEALVPPLNAFVGGQAASLGRWAHQSFPDAFASRSGVPVAPQGAFARPQAAQLANRGATFPDEVKPRREAELHSTEDLRKSISARWRLKNTVARILKENPKGEDGRSYAVCGCGYAAKMKNEDGDLVSLPSVRILRRDEGEKPYVSGSMRCESPWLCPTCGPKKAQDRQEKLKEVIERTDALGGTSAFVTLTISHKRSDRLKELKKVLSEASRKARQGRKWKDLQELGGVLGVVQCVEVLHSLRTGWHYHAHLLVPCEGDPKAVGQAMRNFVARFMREVRKLGGKAEKIGQDIQIIRMDDKSVDQVAFYASKGSAAWEIAGGLKEARDRASRNPWDLVQLANAGDEGAKALFVEYAEAIVGTRSGVVSAALAKKLCMEPSKDDDDAATMVDEEDDDHDHDISVEILTESWRKLMSYGVAWKVLEAAEHGDEPQVEGVIFDLLEEIDGREYQRQIANMQSEKEARIAYVTARSVAEGIMHHRRLGETFSRAKTLAIADIKAEFTFRGKKDFVLPSDAEIGRAVSALASLEWSAH